MNEEKMKVELLVIIASLGLANAVSEWGYANSVFEENSQKPKVAGPLDWNKVNSNCGKSFQSPIDIVPDDTERAEFDNLAFEFNNEQRGKMIGTFRNDGRALVYTLKSKRDDDEQNIKVTQTTFMPTYYRLHRVKIHFGCDDSQGSEHRLKGQKFAGEIQLTFFDEESETFEKALKQKPPKVVIIAAFLKKGSQKNKGMDDDAFVDALQNIRNEGKEEEDVEFSIKKLIPNLGNEAKFYTYGQGTLTIPPCTPNTRWIVLKDTVDIDGEQLESLRGLESEHGQTGDGMCNNYRPIQETEGRQVQRNFALSEF